MNELANACPTRIVSSSKISRQWMSVTMQKESRCLGG